jgi:hypothetical protein
VQITDRKYSEHQVFNALKTYEEFYDSLSTSIMHFVSMGTAALNFDTYIFTSMQGTIESIRLLLVNGRINDAYALLRKYHDSIIINAYEICYLEDNFSIENLVVEKINKWLNGNEKLPEYNIMKQYLEKSKKLEEVNKLVSKDKRYAKIRERCNNHIHYNLFFYMMLNDNTVYNKNRCIYLNRLSEDMKDLFILHFSYLFILNPHYMSSSDYLDALDCGMQPEGGSEYFVAPFIQNAFDSIIKQSRPDLAACIKENSGMQLE